MSRLPELMKQLGRDAALADEYRKDRDAVIRRAGLSKEERDALVNKIYAAIKRLTGLEDGQFASNHVIQAYDNCFDSVA